MFRTRTVRAVEKRRRHVPPRSASGHARPQRCRRLLDQGADSGGTYGGDASYVPVDAQDPAKGYRYVPPTLAPPSLAGIIVDYEVELKDQRADRIVTYNDFAAAEIEKGASFQPFCATADAVPTLYLGFTLPTACAFPTRPVALYLAIAEPDPGLPPDSPSPAGPPRLVWECSEGAGAWRRPGSARRHGGPDTLWRLGVPGTPSIRSAAGAGCRAVLAALPPGGGRLRLRAAAATDSSQYRHGHARLDDPRRDAGIERWRPEPALRDGAPSGAR